MKKITNFLIFALMIVFLGVGIADASQKNFTANVYKKNNKCNPAVNGYSESCMIKTGITYKVLVRNSDTAETILANNGMSTAVTSKTNPVTTAVYLTDGDGTVGKIKFTADPSETLDTYVDLIVVDTAGGYTAFVEDFDSKTHTIVIDETPGVRHHGMIWFGADNNTGTNTGVTFAADTVVDDVVVEVVTVEATETIGVGTNGTAALWRSGVSVATAGYVADTAVPTNGDNNDYWPATTYGSYLATALTGSVAVNDAGGISRIPHYVTGTPNSELSYKGSSGSVNTAGYIHYFFTRLR